MRYRNFTGLVLFLASIFLGCSTVHAQKKENPFQKYIEHRHFTFSALTFSSKLFIMRQLPPENYFIKISGDSVTGSLPFFGEIYSANQTTSGLEFQSTKFDYDAIARKGKWEITITPKDERDIRRMFLTVFFDGSAVLQINCTNRGTASFNGYITVKEGSPIAPLKKAVPTLKGK